MAQPREHDDLGLESLRSLHSVPADDFAAWEPFSRRPRSNGSEPPPNSARRQDQELDEASLRFLRSVIENPGKPSSAYARIARIGPAKAALLRRRLVEEGFLREHVVATRRRGRTAIVVEPLERAKAALKPGGP